jgi:mannose-6-phosphate isomerase-like protein (cupin superfamily)
MATIPVFVFLLLAAPLAQQPPAAVGGDRTTPLRPLGAPNVGLSNAVLLDRPDVRTLRVLVEPGGSRVMHAHTDVKFHLFVPISAAIMLNLEGSPSVTVAPWQPYYMAAGTRHGFRNDGASAVELMEIFVR